MGESDEAAHRPSETELHGSIARAERAKSRIPEGMPPEKVSINDFIASMTDLVESPLNTPDEKKHRERTIGIFTHLRDQQGAQTVGEAQSVLRRREISPEVIRLWIEEGMTGNSFLDTAIKDGYPEFAQAIEEASRRRTARMLNEAGVEKIIGRKLPEE